MLTFIISSVVLSTDLSFFSMAFSLAEMASSSFSRSSISFSSLHYVQYLEKQWLMVPTAIKRKHTTYHLISDSATMVLFWAHHYPYFWCSGTRGRSLQVWGNLRFGKATKNLRKYPHEDWACSVTMEYCRKLCGRRNEMKYPGELHWKRNMTVCYILLWVTSAWLD